MERTGARAPALCPPAGWAHIGEARSGPMQEPKVTQQWGLGAALREGTLLAPRRPAGGPSQVLRSKGTTRCGVCERVRRVAAEHKVPPPHLGVKDHLGVSWTGGRGRQSTCSKQEAGRRLGHGPACGPGASPWPSAPHDPAGQGLEEGR